MKEFYNKIKTLLIYYFRVYLTNKYLVTNVKGYTFIIPKHLAFTSICKRLLQGKIYEKNTIEEINTWYHSHQGTKIVHAGAYIGDMLPFLGFADKVYAFEPVDSYYNIALSNAMFNKLENVELFNLGLSSSEDVKHIKLKNEKGNYLGGSAMISPDGDKINVVTLDSFAFDDIAIIHFDLEGHEIEALKGSLETIERCSPTIIVEAGNYISIERYKEFFRDIYYKYQYNIGNNAIFRR